MPNHAMSVTDNRPLSSEANGVLATLICMPDGKWYAASELYRIFKADPPLKIDSALKELTSGGRRYVVCVNGKYAVNRMKIAVSTK